MKIKTTANKVNEAIEKMKSKGRVSFDGTNGGFYVRGVRGRFSWDGDDTLVIKIDDKPWLASDSMIEEAVNSFFK